MSLNTIQTALLQRVAVFRMGSFHEGGHILRRLIEIDGLGGDAYAAALVKAASRVTKVGIALNALVKTNAMKTVLADTPSANLLGLGAAAGSVVTGTQTNNTSVTETASFIFPLPSDYVAGSPITIRIRGKVSAARFVACTVVPVVKTIIDGVLGANIGPAAQALPLAYADLDFVVTPAGLVAGQQLQVDLTVVNNDTGGNSNGTATISEVSVRSTIST